MFLPKILFPPYGIVPTFSGVSLHLLLYHNQACANDKGEW